MIMKGEKQSTLEENLSCATLSAIDTMSYMSNRAQKQLTVHYTAPPFFKILQDIHKKTYEHYHVSHNKTV
jgi:hypothetical protein